ncbi:unnamed protein product [Allacma fusca]|uniref:Uncharacterized protein n=1 Tax=Allacma fusca TaxID=39272 RepID=A0A8J2KDX8_9HEXA|nr:unnamed protein product [Allacma fusca]
MEMNIRVPPTHQPPRPVPSPVSGWKGRDKVTKNYVAFERTSRDLLRRQRSIELGRRSHKRIIIPSRSYSLKSQSRFSSSVGHLLFDGKDGARRASCDPRCVNWDDETCAQTRDVMTPSHHYHNNNNNNNNTNNNNTRSKESNFDESFALPSPRNSVIDSVSGSGNDVRKQRQTSIVLNMPSRQASVRSYTSGRSVSSVSQATSAKTKSICGPSSPTNLRNSLAEEGVGRQSRCSSRAFGTASMSLKDLPSKERRHRKVAVAVIIFSSFLLISAVLCIIISLHRTTQEQLKAWVRKENEHLLKVIQQTSVNVTSSSTTSTLLQTDTNVSHNHNNNNLVSSDSYHNSNPTGGQPLPRTTDIIGGVPEDYSLHETDKNPDLNEGANLRSTNTEAFEQSDQDQ